MSDVLSLEHYLCVHCKMHRAEHADGKCLFEATSFVAMTVEQLTQFITPDKSKLSSVWFNSGGVITIHNTPHSSEIFELGKLTPTDLDDET